MSVRNLDALLAPATVIAVNSGGAGLVVPRSGVSAGCLRTTASGGPAAEAVANGQIAWVSQSGDLAREALKFAIARHIGVSIAVALGDEADVDCADVLDYLASEPHTVGVVVAVDHVKAARKFMSAARACVRNKPVVIWCRPAPGEDPLAYDAAFERAGLVRVADVDALFDAFATLQSPGVSSSALIADYVAACERLAHTPPALPLHRVEVSEARAFVDSIGDADAPRESLNDGQRELVAGGAPQHAGDDVDRALSTEEAQRLLGYFDLDVFAGEDSQAPDAAGEYASALIVALEMRDDRTFGPFVAISAGARTVSALLPLNAALAHDALRPLAQACGWGARDVDQTVDMLVSLSCLLCCIDRIRSFGAIARVAAGAVTLERVSIRMGAAGARRALAIRPYPVELEETIEWEGGTLTIRPIRPEDESAHAALFHALTPEDRRLRFFHYMREPEHSQLARFVQIDYEREMALIACTRNEAGGAVIHGVVRAVTGPDGEVAECAVTIRSDEKGHHLGRILMDRIIKYCRSRGTRTLIGSVLPENARMLALARDCGFVVEEDGDVKRIRMTLAHG